jgi:hypothetical protein
VEAAGVEPVISVENTQLTDSGNACNSSNATISRSSVQIAYKDLPELQNFQASSALARHAEVLFIVYTLIECRRDECGFEFFMDTCAKGGGIRTLDPLLPKLVGKEPTPCGSIVLSGAQPSHFC